MKQEWHTFTRPRKDWSDWMQILAFCIYVWQKPSKLTFYNERHLKIKIFAVERAPEGINNSYLRMKSISIEWFM